MLLKNVNILYITLWILNMFNPGVLEAIQYMPHVLNNVFKYYCINNIVLNNLIQVEILNLCVLYLFGYILYCSIYSTIQYMYFNLIVKILILRQFYIKTCV